MKKTIKVYPPGMKWTRQRKTVYDILWETTEPISAQTIYNRTLQYEKQESYAVSTVYRILAAFEEKNLITKTTMMEDNTALYELNKGGHTHYAICLGCHKKLPLEHCPIGELALAEDGEEFEVTGHRLEVYGYCKVCRKFLLGTG